MKTSTGTDLTAASPTGAVQGPRERLVGMAVMLCGGMSNQLGASTAALAFPVIGPAGVVAVRQWVAGLVLMSLGRPRMRSFTWRQWWPVLSMALVFATMNLTLYFAVDRIGLGLAVTLEFLGPLAVALAASRRWVDLGCALVAGVAVAVLMRPQPSSDHTGLALALLAAACWAGYILLNRTVGRRVSGIEGSAASAGVSALLFVPVGAWVLWHHPPTPVALACAAAAGVLSSTVPFLGDLFALRRVPTRFFGLFMSVHPVMAALAGLVVLDQALDPVDCAAIAAVVAANAASALTAGRTRVR
ncbi:inner membrane transporter RhtA [Nocardiopsis arvandica]|uniref:Inner membrane transporter RhtA n=1 Tax=Nocardiopsis sinuspersici TaxID=501010 RepID=A0A7Y9XIQ3_9ACTN|nr:EamA family transporter [Nocardiopsis sinuspersici]NYH55228.1 inner membrane transporter RhtA [Nocardiopsis sinuspersici]